MTITTLTETLPKIGLLRQQISFQSQPGPEQNRPYRQEFDLSMPTCQVIQLPKIHDPRGNLTFIEGENHIPFAIERVYWIYDSPGGENRGGRACQDLHEFIIAISGSFDVVLDNSQDRMVCTLNRSYFGLYIPPMTWRWLENFSTNSFALVLASKAYDEADYIRDYAEFVRLKLK